MDETSRRNRKSRALRLKLAMTLALPLAGFVSAHGGEGDQLNGSAPVWMIGLIYMQLFMIPVVGLWLVKQTFSAWLRPAGQIENQKERHDTFK